MVTRRRPRPQAEKLDRVRVQVRDVFARVLTRDPGIRTVIASDGSLDIHFRDRIYHMTVWASLSSVSVTVSKNPPKEEADTFLASTFFSFSCPTSRMGRLRKTALILHKKMQHAEVYEVMEA